MQAFRYSWLRLSSFPRSSSFQKWTVTVIQKVSIDEVELLKRTLDIIEENQEGIMGATSISSSKNSNFQLPETFEQTMSTSSDMASFALNDYGPQEGGLLPTRRFPTCNAAHRTVAHTYCGP